MAVTAVQIHGAGCVVAVVAVGVGICVGICRESGMGVSAGVVLVVAVPVEDWLPPAR